MRTSLRTTTAMLAALSLVVPTTLHAQNNAAAEAVQACAENAADCDPAAVAEGLANDLTEAEATAEQDAAAAEAQAAEEAAAAAEAQAAEEAAAAAEAQAAEEAAAAAEAQAAEEAAAVAEAQAAEEAAAEAQAAEEAAAAADAQAAEEADAAEAQTAEDVEAQAAAEAAAQAQTEAEAEAAAETQAAEQPETGQIADEEAARNAEGPADAAATDPEATAEAADPAATEAEAALAAEQEADRAALQAQRQAEEAAAQSAAALAAAMNTDESAGEVVEETVTEETARSSDEDFTGEIQAEAGATPQVSSGGGGLSNLEKALIVGAGALAVGALIRGNREVVSTAPDRVVVSSSDGNYQVLKDDAALLRQPGNQVQTRTFDDGSTRSVVTRADGSQVVTIQDPEMRVVRRALIRPDGSEVLLIDDTVAAEPVDVSALPAPAQSFVSTNDDALRAALEREGAFNRRFTLSQVRQIDQVRKLAPSIEVASIQFETGSAAIRPDEARKLADLGLTISRAIEANPNEIFLVEGHTDAVGSRATNLILSDRRAESLALALTEYFGVPPENLVVQGYGEADLKVDTDTAEPANRRAELRRITNLLQVAALN